MKKAISLFIAILMLTGCMSLCFSASAGYGIYSEVTLYFQKPAAGNRFLSETDVTSDEAYLAINSVDTYVATSWHHFSTPPSTAGSKYVAGSTYRIVITVCPKNYEDEFAKASALVVIVNGTAVKESNLELNSARNVLTITVDYLARSAGDWVTLPYSTEGLKDGDYYFDLQAYKDMRIRKEVEDGMTLEDATGFINDLLDHYLRDNLTICYNKSNKHISIYSEEDQDEYEYKPGDNTYTGYIDYVKQYKAENKNVCPWCGGDHSSGFLEMIVGWFHKILAMILGKRY